MNIAINGFGRIGRAVLKIALERGMNVVVINDVHGVDDAVYLLKYDSIYGRYKGEVIGERGSFSVNGKKIKVLNEMDPAKLPWKQLKVDVVVESTGIFRDREGAKKHLKAGAKYVLISAPAEKADVTVVLGVNDKMLNKDTRIISVASCTTNCLAPIVRILNDNFGIEHGMMTTAHGYTNDQALHDGFHKQKRRGRAAALNIVPTSSGATEAINEVFPELKDKIKGVALRVPVAAGSIVDFVAQLRRSFDIISVNGALRKAANGSMKGILEYTTDEIVSSDVLGNSHSAVVDGLSTMKEGNLVKVLAWYDNEYGYSSRVVDVIGMLNKWIK
ncbi:MAG: type I glyceraldehyde-3-phosphate dehydrogenase [Nanoarchaeota archaeon]|nr:type I glyceraldehyde-3-phosphate dehydrogenase [Nanoarchaeota archaeon]